MGLREKVGWDEGRRLDGLLEKDGWNTEWRKVSQSICL